MIIAVLLPERHHCDTKWTAVAFYLGLDGGGTKTTCLVGDDSCVLGRGSAAGCNILRVGESEARRNLHAAVREACTAAGIQPREIASTCAGVAGLGAAQVTEAARRIIAEIIGGELELVGDMDVAMEASFGAGAGVIVIAGTGSIAFGRNERGDMARAGGWGFAISDEGSGQWIGRAAVRAALRSQDRGEASELLARIMQAWHVGSHEQVVARANSSPPPNFAELFPAVLAAATAGDRVSGEVLTRAGRELANLADDVLQRLWPTGAAGKVAMTGGVFRSSNDVRSAFLSSLYATHPAVAVAPEIVEPVMGALALARAHAGVARR